MQIAYRALAVLKVQEPQTLWYRYQLQSRGQRSEGHLRHGLVNRAVTIGED